MWGSVSVERLLERHETLQQYAQGMVRRVEVMIVQCLARVGIEIAPEQIMLFMPEHVREETWYPVGVEMALPGHELIWWQALAKVFSGAEVSELPGRVTRVRGPMVQVLSQLYMAQCALPEVNKNLVFVLSALETLLIAASKQSELCASFEPVSCLVQNVREQITEARRIELAFARLRAQEVHH